MTTVHNTHKEKAVPKRIAVVGVGTCGSRAVEQMAQRPSRAIDFVSIDTDPDELVRCTASRPMQISMTGLRAARPQHARDSADRAASQIRAALQGAELVLIVAGMTDATAVGAAPVVARLAREMGMPVAAVATLPGQWEGTPKRLERAEAGVVDLRAEIAVVLVLPCETLAAKLDNEDASMAEMDAYTDAMVVRTVSCIVEATEGRADVGVDFENLGRVLSVPGTTAVGTADLLDSEIPQAVDRLLACPLLGGSDLSVASEVLVALRGPARLLHCAGRVLHVIAHATPNTAAVMGTTVADESMGDQLQLTLIATGIVGAPHEAGPSRTAG
jgi:cell division protein FtsZ